MSRGRYDRLSTLEAGWLASEGPNAHMHMGGVGVFDAGALARPDGGLDIDAIRAHVGSRLHGIPRTRQRLAHTPLERHPIWVDDARFNIDYHVRHTSLPFPASERQLKRLAGRILSQKLDRGKPLWELWFVEGLAEGRFALIAKVHQCMIDRTGRVELMDHLLRKRPDASVERARPWTAQPAPDGRRLLLDAALAQPLELFRDARDALSEPQRALRATRDALTGLGQALQANLGSASDSPFNVGTGPHRRIDWTRMELDTVKELTSRLGGTMGDVLLALVAGALRRFLAVRSVRASDLDFRALIPVHTRPRAGREDELESQLSFLIVRLPLDVTDPRERVRLVSKATRELEGSKIARGTQALVKLSSWTTPRIWAQTSRTVKSSRFYNVLISNDAGPRHPVFLLGARQREVYPAVALFPNQALGIGIASYDGFVHWGLHADWDAIPDLYEPVGMLQEELDSMRKAAVAPAAPKPSRRGPPARRRKSRTATSS
jgi:WS/DGAT/MGAT family acyltransferase